MIRSMDTFLAEVNSRKAKRRRMLSLLLGLSMVVTSGVSWALHGVGLTLANEVECGIGEHIHTDDCYERQLVCGLEEDDTHTHDESCWEQQLVCGLEEHIHDTGCFTAEDDSGRTVTIRSADAADATDDDGASTAVIIPKPVQRAPGDPLSTVETIDNIAEGIKFTLFDYGGSELESQNNNYIYRMHNENGQWVLDNPPYVHENISYTGINTGRDELRDILFLAYGTPVPYGANGPVVQIDGINGETVYNNENGYHPDKNSYSGDYDTAHYYSGNRPVSNIVLTDLGEDGYPVLNAPGNHSLAYLFAPSTYDAERNVDQSGYKTVYDGVNHEGVNHLLQRDGTTNHLFYDSNEYYAYFNQETNNFEVYNQTFDIINDAHHKDKDINYNKIDPNTGEPVQYDGNKDEGFKIGFFPFDPYDDTRRDPNFDGNGYNHHFGMTMEAEFTNPSKANVTDPITFKYSGDDDMWVFVDGKLVLDIGGIHEPTGGMIDFTNGIVWTQDNGRGETMDQVRTKLQSWGIVHNDDEWSKLPMPIGTDTSSTSTSGGNKWIVQKLSDIINGWDDTAHTKSHKINMFYLERGGCYSNLAMEMNLPTLKPLTVIKNVDYQQHLVKGLYEDTEYEFQVWEYDKTNKVWVIPQDTDSDGDFYLPGSSFFLKDGERKVFEGLGQDRQFRVVEKNIDPNLIDRVEINDSPVTVEEGQASLTGALLSAVNSYTFDNRITEKTEPITIKKAWAPENVHVPDDYDTVKFRIWRTDDQTGERKQVALLQDGVKVRTFTITAAEWEAGKTITSLLSQYGDHTYSYEVEELNCPKNFVPSYTTDESGALVITNTDNKNVDIFVEKRWENTENPPKVRLKLTRERIGYEPSKPTTLTINITDEAGNLLTSYTTPQQTAGTPYQGVYSGGGAEFSYGPLPTGAVLCEEEEGVNPVKSPSSIVHKFHDDERILVVENLAEGTNTLTFKVRTADEVDPLLLEHHSFSDSSIVSSDGQVQGWTVQNDMTKQSYEAKVAFDSTRSYGKNGGSLHVYDRTKCFNGAVLHLDPAKFHSNGTYSFSTYVYSPVGDTFKMTFVNGLGGYIPIGQVEVPAGEWVQLTGSRQLSGNLDPYNMYLIVESLDNGDESCRGTEFWIDEFTAVEGNTPVTVSSTDGKVTVDSGESGGGEVYNIHFNDTFGDWTQNNNPNVSMTSGHDYVNNLHFMTVSSRQHTNEGVRLNASFLIPGHTYRFEGMVQGDGPNNNSRIQLTLDTINGTENGNGNQSRYRPVGEATVSNYDVGYFDVEFPVPEYANRNDMYLYFETQPYAQNGGDTNPFRIHGLRITDITPGASDPGEGPPEKEGYEIVEDRYYVSDYTDYHIRMDPNSVTEPAAAYDEAGYQPDTEFEKIITLPDDSDNGASWTYHWGSGPGNPGSHHIDEDHGHFSYRYHIEEMWIDSEGNEVQPNDNGDLVSLDDMYLVTYLNNDVSTNTADNPIVVKNKNIWYRLPETGGFGTDAFYGAGLFLITTGLIGGYAFKKRERRFR